jgi:uncharacterized membrane protein
MHTEEQLTQPLQNDDHSIDQTIGYILMFGMYLAAVVILAGGIMFLYAHGNERPNYHTFQLLPQSLRSPLPIVKNAFHGDSLSIMQLGMLLLIATPIARVVFSVIAFATHRDKLYVAISTIVLGVLLYSLILH